MTKARIEAIYSTDQKLSKDQLITHLNHVFYQVAKQTGIKITLMSESFVDLSKLPGAGGHTSPYNGLEKSSGS
jgi:hypothetical protein